MTDVSAVEAPDSLVGHYAGPMTRLLAYLADLFIAVSAYGLLLSLAVFVWNVLVDGDLQAPTDSTALWALGIAAWLLLYNAVSWSVWWKTPGQALLGLRVVERDGSDLTARRAWLRALCFPFSFIVPFGLIGVVVGRERRALHDVMAKTAVVYHWDARTARWRLVARRRFNPESDTD